MLYVKNLFGHCKPAQLLLVDEKKSLFISKLVIEITSLDMKIANTKLIIYYNVNG